jgi:hypothetical protein
MKMILFFALLISLPSFAQDKTGTVPPVRLGNITTTTATTDQILSFPRLLVMNPTCVAKSFTITFLPKGEELIGPYHTNGPALTGEEIAIVKKLNGTPTRIIIEDIEVSCGGPEMNAKAIVLNTVSK